MPATFVVGPQGLPLWRYQDWRALREQRWREAYGPDADVRPETPDGVWTDTLTLGDTLHHDATQSVWANSFFRTAEGVNLDLILDLFSRLRIPAAATTVTAVWYGDPTTVIWDGLGTPPAAVVESVGPTDGDRYLATEAGTLTDPTDGSPMVIRINAVTDGYDYEIAIDAIDTATVTAGPTDTPATIAALVAAEILVAQPTWTVTATEDPGGLGLIVVADKGAEVIDYGSGLTEETDVTFFGAAVIAMEGEVTGARQCLAGTLTGVAQLANGIEGVINLADGDPGRDLETDVEYRARHLDQVNFGGKGTAQRIRAAALDLGPDLVEFARVDAVPGSAQYTLTVIGDATDDEIGAVLLDQTPAGIETLGSTTVVVTDDVGEEHELHFERGVELYLHLEIEITTGEGWVATDPEDAITEAVVTYLDDLLTMGSDLYLVALTAPVLATVAGVAAISVTAGTTSAPGDPTPALTGDDVEVASGEVLRAASTRISVVIV